MIGIYYNLSPSHLGLNLSLVICELITTATQMVQIIYSLTEGVDHYLLVWTSKWLSRIRCLRCLFLLIDRSSASSWSWNFITLNMLLLILNLLITRTFCLSPFLWLVGITCLILSIWINDISRGLKCCTIVVEDNLLYGAATRIVFSVFLLYVGLTLFSFSVC